MIEINASVILRECVCVYVSMAVLLFLCVGAVLLRERKKNNKKTKEK